MAAPESLTLHYSYASPYHAAGAEISMIDASGPQQLELRLFIDEIAHQIRAIRYTGILLPYVCPLNASSEQTTKHGKLGLPGGGISIRSYPPHRRTPVEIEMQLDDYRLEGGVSLLLTRLLCAPTGVFGRKRK